MFSQCACFISTALPYVEDSFKELGLVWMLPACNASKGAGKVIFVGRTGCKVEAVGLRRCAGPT